MVYGIINHAVSEKVTARKKKEIKTAKWGRYNHVYVSIKRNPVAYFF